MKCPYMDKCGRKIKIDIYTFQCITEEYISCYKYRDLSMIEKSPLEWKKELNNNV